MYRIGVVLIFPPSLYCCLDYTIIYSSLSFITTQHPLAGCGEEGNEECQNCIQDSKWRRISPTPTYQEIRCHMIFDVKMEDFHRNARFVAGVHTTDIPHAMTYVSVVSRESVRIALTLADLNDLDAKMADIENAYLTAPITEKV
jgi:hypothetical protein